METQRCRLRSVWNLNGVFRRAYYLAQMMRNERRDPARILAAQNRQLCRLVRHAAGRVPCYRDLYATHGVDIANFRGIEDLPGLPVVDKLLLRAASDGAVATDAPSDLVTIGTSGSTGSVFEFRIDRDFDDWRKAQYLRPYLTNGRALTDRVLHLRGVPTSGSPWLARLGLLRETALSCAIDPAEIVGHWQRLGPDLLQGYPSVLRLLALYCLDNGVTLQPAPRHVFTDSELLTEGTRRLLERVWNTRVVDVFGTYETDNIAYQCEEIGGYHLALDCVVAEVLRDGKPVPAGETGELVVTVLRNRTSPFIRYNLHDLVALDTRPCPCGRTLPLLRVIEGRANDQIRLPGGGQRSAMALLGSLDGLGELVKECQVEQAANGDIIVRVVPGVKFGSDARRRIEQIVRAELPGSGVQVITTSAIARASSEKFKHFVSRAGGA